MNRVSVDINSLNMTLQVEVYPYQKAASIVKLVFNQLNFNQELRQSIQSTLLLANNEVDVNKTIEALDINQYSILEIKFSKKIKIEIDNPFLGLITRQVDVFESVNYLKAFLMREIIQLVLIDVVITFTKNGMILDKDSWAKYGIFKDSVIGLKITKQQKITYNQQQYEMAIDMFQPIAKIIHEFTSKNKIYGDFVIFKNSSGPLNPDEVYKNQNQKLESIWTAEIPSEFVYKIQFEQENREIKVQKDTDVFDLIRNVRTTFKIEKTIPLKLEYKLTNYTLDIDNTIKQEFVPPFSILTLVKETSDNKINIQLVDKQTKKKQVLRVFINSLLSQLDNLIIYDQQTQKCCYFVNDQIKDQNCSLQQLELKSESIIEYMIQPQDQESTYIKVEFNNVYTKQQVFKRVLGSSSIEDELKEIVKYQIIKSPAKYNVQINNQRVDIQKTFNQLQLIQNTKIFYFTNYVIFQGQVGQQILELEVDQNDSIQQIEDQFKTNKQLDQQSVISDIQNKSETLKQFLQRNQNFRFIFKMQNEHLKKSLDISIFVKELRQIQQINVKQDDYCSAICESLKRRNCLGQNQVIKVYIGDREINQNESIQQIINYLNESNKQLIVDVLTYLVLHFENQDGQRITVNRANLEDTLKKVNDENNIEGEAFTYNQQNLDPLRKIGDQPIENNAVIKYLQKIRFVTFQNNRTGQQIQFRIQNETLQEFIPKLGYGIKAFEYNNQKLDFSTKVRALQLPENANIKYDEEIQVYEPSNEQDENKISQQKEVIILGGQSKLVYRIDANTQVGRLKEQIYNDLLGGQGNDIQFYALTYQGERLFDDQLISSIHQDSPLEIQIELLSSITIN